MASAHGVALAFMLATCLGAIGAINPGFVVRITQKGLDYARQEGMRVLQKELSKIHIPDFSGSTHTHIGKVKYSFSSMNIRSFQLPNSQINLVPNVGLKLSISGAFIEVDGQWRVRYKFMNIRSFQLPNSQINLVPNVGLKLSISGAFIEVDGQWRVRYKFISDHGHFDLKVEGISISVGMKLGSDGQGRPTISPSDCSSYISNVDVHISGKFSWLVDIFHHQIDSAFRKAIEDQICPLVSQSISSKLGPLLQTLPVTAKIDHVAAIDYSLIGPPPVTAEVLDAQLKGEFFYLSHRSTPPFPALPMSFPVDHDLMVYFAAGSYLFNTAGFVYHSAGALVFNVTDDMIPKNFSVRLNTSSFGTLIPQISKMYPNMLMKLKIESASAPFLNIKPGNLTISPVMDIQAYAILPNSSLAPLFLLNVTTNALVKIAVNSGRIVGNLELSRVEMVLKHSDVGPFSVTVLNLAVNYYISNVLLPQVNEILKKGYPLPLLDHVQLTDVVLQPYENFILFGANVHNG